MATTSPRGRGRSGRTPAPRNRRPGGAAARRRRRRAARGAAQLRLRTGFVFIAVVLSFFGARLVQLQGVSPDEVRDAGGLRGRHRHRGAARPTRGEILDRDGKPLADSVDGRMVVADPSHDAAPRRHELARFLSRRLHVDYFQTLQRPPAEGQPLRLHRPPRARPPSRSASSTRRAAAGLQGPRHPRRPGALLPRPRRRGQPGRLHGHRRAAGRARARVQPAAGRAPPARRPTRWAPATGSRSATARSSPAHNGTDLHTTIDEDLQWYTQRVLRQTVLGARGDSGFAVVMDSHTGEILSLADYPTYDATNPQASPAKDRNSPGDDQPLRAGLGGEGAHPQLADRRRQGHRPHPAPGARAAAER